MFMDRIRIVLVAPSHSGNIGGCARAMKNMGLSRLYLVTPDDFPGAEATARAAGAEDLLDHARICASLDEAVAECHLVIGTSARGRRIPWPVVTPDEAARRIVKTSAEHEVAVVFGRERTGLTNEELDRCQALVNIPTDPGFTSLNLACAVQVVAYEILRVAENEMQKHGSVAATVEALGEPLATHAEVQRFYGHLEEVLVETGFLDPKNPRLLMRRLMRLFNRVELTNNEVNILRGILTAVAQTRGRTKT
jgi:tRNA (cytidine32/uridine32-2'-O)-methyltransferase